MSEFNAASLLHELEPLGRGRQVVFAMTCIEVMLPSYIRFCELEGVGDTEGVTRTVQTVWDALASGGEELSVPSLPSSDVILELIPREDEWNEWAPQAENAVAGLSFLVSLINGGDASLAVRTAQQAYEAADELAARQDLDGGFLDAAGRAELLGSPVVQSELQRQEGVLGTLRGLATLDGPSLAELRRSSQAAALGGG